MRGWKLLLNAGLEGRERTQILTTTNNSYEYTIVAQALKEQWNDLELKERDRSRKSHQARMLEAQAAQAASASASSGHDPNQQTYFLGVPDLTVEAMVTAEVATDEEYKALVATLHECEGLALEARRNLTQARAAVTQYRNDRGFGKVALKLRVAGNKGKGKGGKGGKGARWHDKDSGCFNCGAPGHLARDCTDATAPTRALHAAIADAHAFQKGKGKGKHQDKGGGKYSKAGYWLEDQYAGDDAWIGADWDLDEWSWDDRYDEANAATMLPWEPQEWLDSWGLELTGSEAESAGALPQLAPETPSTDPSSGLVDTGASASAGPRQAVEDFCVAIAAADPSIKIVVDYTENCRPHFRFGNGQFGRAEFFVKINSLATKRHVLIFALPNPKGFPAKQRIPTHKLVPILVGMPFLRPNHAITDLQSGDIAYADLRRLLLIECHATPRGTFWWI